MDKEKVIVIDFGGQYNQLVARRVRECNVYCEIYSYRTDIETIKAMNPKGIILTGGPNSCYEADSPTYSKELFELGIPVLGLCYGAQLMMHVLGGKVEKAPVREYGKTEVMVDKNSPLFQNVEEKTICWMSHFDYISKTAPGFEIVAHTADCPVAAAENREKISMPSSFTRRYSIPKREPRCSTTSCVVSVAVPEHGEWIPLWKIPSRKSVKKSATEECFWHCPVEWILLWQQVFYPEQSESSLPAYLLTMAFFVKTREMKWKMYSDRMVSLT